MYSLSQVSLDMLSCNPMIMFWLHLKLTDDIYYEQMFGVVFTSYIKDPINCLLQVGYTILDSELLNFFKL